ncbi:MAG: proline--tRNA ligase [Firmicutes bacterium]|nr:proline--tRNA ligase [Bacillota bacterium]
MRMTQLYSTTLREVPAEAEIASHQLMLRAGLIHKVSMGIYTYMPLGWRTLRKIENIIREEMDAYGGQELLMPVVSPADVWQESGRWWVYGKELMRMKDRHERDYLLAPTHEEIITTTVRQDIRSYKQLPLLPYQIQTKFRDERRPRFGVMRCREFIMKDGYSFDRDEEGLAVTYRKMHDAYTNMFTRCGLNFRPVAADSGAIGGEGSHEFMALSEVGESQILFCNHCDYAATDEFASVDPVPTGVGEEMKEIVRVETPNCKTMEQLAELLKVPSDRAVKSLCYVADEKRFILVLVRGDRQVNEVKLNNALDCFELRFATDEEIRAHGMEPGYCGPVGIGEDVEIFADREVPLMVNHECGGVQKDFHLLNVNYQRGDYRIDKIADLALVEAGAKCPICGAPLDSARGIEVGQIFKLHTKYSDKLHCVYVDEAGEEHPMVMGCYGIGVGRTMAAVIEQHHDENGISWPITVAPYEVLIVPVNDKDEWLVEQAENIYRSLGKQGVEVLIDDRKERPGVKFNDADLLGFPIRVTMGKKCHETGNAEIKIRETGEVLEVPVDQVVEKVLELKASMLAALQGPYAWEE